MPRAKYLQTMVMNIIGICVGSAVALLGIWSSVQARKHTTPVGSTARYNSSQSAVCAIWLFANIWFFNVMRAKVSQVDYKVYVDVNYFQIPALQFPVIMFSIFTNVAFTYGPLFSTIEQGESFVKRLLEGFLTAFAISTGVNWFIFPVTSRTVLFKEATGYIKLVQGSLKAQTAYLQSLESSDMFASTEEGGKCLRPSEHPEAMKLTGTIAALNALHGKIYGDLPFAKREVAWGKLDAKELDQIFVLLRKILIPL